MIELVTWLLAVEALGLAALPVAFLLLRNLPDAGVAYAKPLGLLLVGYAVWLGSAFGILAHTQATIVAAVLLLSLSWVAVGQQTVATIRAHRRDALWAEAVFLGGFAFAAILRAYNPEIVNTEKPMDFAFLRAALRDEGVPPQDPWLSGFGISYYYFGYFLFALVAKLAGTPGAYAFNLALATIFGLVAAGAFSLVRNLVAGREGNSAGASSGEPIRFGLLGAALTLLLSNLEGLFEVFRVNNVLSADFWRWLGIKDLAGPARVPALFPTDPPDTWWWWRASRVVGDFDPLTGVTRDYTINEFPFFSFMLGDLHPHVMSLPFAFLALALGLSLVRRREELSGRWFRANAAFSTLAVIVVGGLGFLNSWDLPALLVVLVLLVTAQRAMVGPLPRRTLVLRALVLGAVALAVALALYLPFYVGFRTQASGLGLVATRTKVQHLFIVWGPLLTAAAAVPLYLAFAGRPRQARWAALAFGLAAGAAALLDIFRGGILQAVAGERAEQVGPVLGALTAVLLAGILVPSAIAYWRLLGAPVANRRSAVPEDLFVLVLVGSAASLIAACEIVFVRDGFGNRMNTVFKLYYQAWVLLAPSAAYALYFLGQRRRQLAWRGATLAGYRLWRGAAVGLIACGFVYTALAPFSKTGNFAGTPTLDGMAWLQARSPHEREAIAWLDGQPGSPVLLEASGGEYSDFNRASAFTGLPSVLGWAGHEYQWRGTTPEPGQRKADIDAIYGAPDIATARDLLRKYRVSLVYVGDHERQTYGASGPTALEKFARLGEVAFRNDRVVIYRVQ